MLEQKNDKKNNKSIKILKIILKNFFLKPPFLGEIILLVCVYLGIMNIMFNTVSSNNLGTICSSIATSEEIKKYKEGITKKFISDLKSEGVSPENIDLTEEDLKKYVGVNFIKTGKDYEGKNLINGDGIATKGTNLTSTYNYLDAYNNPIEVEYSTFSTAVNRNGVRYYARIGDLIKEGVKKGGAVDLSLFNAAEFSDSIEIPISNLAEPFLVKQSIPLYLYASTYNKDIVNSFIENNVFDSEISFEYRSFSIGSQGTESDKVYENCKIAEVIFDNDTYKIGELNDNIVTIGNKLYIEEPRYFKEAQKDECPVPYYGVDSHGYLLDINDKRIEDKNNPIFTSIGEFNIDFSVNVPTEGYNDCDEKSISSAELLDILKGDTELIELPQASEPLDNIEPPEGPINPAESISIGEVGQRVWVNEGNGKFSLYECFEMPYYTIARIGMNGYLLKSAKTWFGNFYFENIVNGGGYSTSADYGMGGTNGTKIHTTCRYEVNKKAKEALLNMFKYDSTDSSLSNLSLFASYIEKNAIENDDYNLKLVYYGLCRMFENDAEVYIPLNKEIEEEFGSIENIQISTVPDYAYNILMSSMNIPDPYPLVTVSGMGGLSSRVEGDFREYTMSYGPCYRKKFPTKMFTVFNDLSQPSGFTLDEFYEIGEYYAQVRYNKVKEKESREKNLEYCLKLAETMYNLEQDVGINGVYILSKSTIEGGWASSPYSINDGNLWGYGVRKNDETEDKNDTINHNKDSVNKIYPQEMDEKYSEKYQKCAYQVACYIKTIYLKDKNELLKILKKIEKNEEIKELCNRLKANQSNLKLKDIKNTGNNLTEEEFNKLISFIKDEEEIKLLKSWRYWNGEYSDLEIGKIYSNNYGPTFYGIDNIYVHGWGYENKSYEATECSNMARFYNLTKGWLEIIEVNNTKYGIVNIIDTMKFARYVQYQHIAQVADPANYGDSCLMFSYAYVYFLNGLGSYSNLTPADGNEGSKYHAGYRSTTYENEEDVLKAIYYELAEKGLPVIVQVNGSKKSNGKYSRHFVVFIGIKTEVKDASNLTGNEFVFIDSWDGRIKTTDMENGGKRWIFNAKEEGNYSYNYRIYTRQ